MVNMTVSRPNSVVIKVTPPADTGGMPITGYVVQYSDVNTSKPARCSNVCCGGTVVEILDSRIYRWRFGLAVTEWRTSTKLPYVGPG